VALEYAEESAAKQTSSAAAAAIIGWDIAHAAAATTAVIMTAVTISVSDAHGAARRLDAFCLSPRDGKGVSGNKCGGEHGCARYDQLLHVEPRLSKHNTQREAAYPMVKGRQ
jgi:hypothetical protein